VDNRTGTDRPLLLIDIDGVISLFGFDPSSPPAGSFVLVDGIGHLLSAVAGDYLRALGRAFELVWCSGWEEKANDYLPLALGLPGPLPFVALDGPASRVNAHWKLAAIDAYAGADRPLAWVDDALDERCQAWVAARPAPTLLVATEPAVGLTAGQVAQLLEWARTAVSRSKPPLGR
jgi:hypothetical protein